MNDRIETKPVTRRVHPVFWEMIEEIQTEKIVQGITKATDKTPKHIITKQIANLIMANPKIKKMLVEVKIEDGNEV